jgi:hypothetical protein
MEPLVGSSRHSLAVSKTQERTAGTKPSRAFRHSKSTELMVFYWFQIWGNAVQEQDGAATKGGNGKRRSQSFEKGAKKTKVFVIFVCFY